MPKQSTGSPLTGRLQHVRKLREFSFYDNSSFAIKAIDDPVTATAVFDINFVVGIVRRGIG